MKHTAFRLTSLVAACAAQPLFAAPAAKPPQVIQPMVTVSAEIAMPATDVHTWTSLDDDTPRPRRHREHARRHDAAVRAGLATLLSPAPGQANISLRRPLLGRDLRPMSGNVMPEGKSKGGSRHWTDDE